MSNIRVLFVFMLMSSSTSVLAQPLKIGVFDSDIMVQVLPGYHSIVDSVVERFVADSLDSEYSFYRQEYYRLDSTYRLDSISKKSRNILDLKKQQRDELAVTLINWERIAQYRIQQKRTYLAAPFYEKVAAAYKKVVIREKYSLVLKPNTYEAFTSIDNVFAQVAKELNIKLPKELTLE